MHIQSQHYSTRVKSFFAIYSLLVKLLCPLLSNNYLGWFWISYTRLLPKKIFQESFGLPTLEVSSPSLFQKPRINQLTLLSRRSLQPCRFFDRLISSSDQIYKKVRMNHLVISQAPVWVICLSPALASKLPQATVKQQPCYTSSPSNNILKTNMKHTNWSSSSLRCHKLSSWTTHSSHRSSKSCNETGINLLKIVLRTGFENYQKV